MAIDLETAYPGKVGAASSEWPLGEPRNIVVPGDGKGTPWEEKGVKDMFGTLHALIRSSGANASGTPETAEASQFMQAIVELASGRAFNYDDVGVVNDYVLNVQSGQQSPHEYFDGMQIAFTPDNINTGASTINIDSLGIRDIKLTGGVHSPAPGTVSDVVRLTYRVLPSPHFEMSLNDAPGEMFEFGGAVAPTGSVIYAGQELVKIDYPALYAAIGDVWATTGGAAAPSTGNFRLPPQQIGDLGLYNRGVGATNGGVGTYQSDVFKEHNHEYQKPIVADGYDGSSSEQVKKRWGTATVDNAGDPVETRPRSITVLKCIWVG